MDVIKITPAELRAAAKSTKDLAAVCCAGLRAAGAARTANAEWARAKEDARKLRALAAKLEHDGREALEFVPVKYEGVQA